MRGGVVVAVAAIGVAVAACSAASTANVPNVSGTYLMSVVDGTNGCMLAGVTERVAIPGVPLIVSQDTVTPQNMTVVLGGSPGMVLTGLAGTTTLTGTLGSYQATLVPEQPDAGNPPTGKQGSCTYTASPSLLLNFSGDTVQGTMTYTLSTTGGNCQSLINCQTVQAFAGVLTSPDT